MSSPPHPTDASPEPAAVIILGADAFLAALPATPAQLVEACLAAGFAAAVPASWGDEVVADAALKELARRGGEPSILAVCPHVVERLLSAGPDLERWMLPLVPPPVATARYLRALYGGVPVRITYAGACSSGTAPEMDERLLPSQLAAMLAARGIDPAAVRADGAPPSHRRFRSLPGGAPTPELLFAQGGRSLVELEEEDLAEAVAQRLMARERALFDLAPRLGCACSGAIPDCAPQSARAAVAAIEPPRARDEVLDPTLAVDASRALPRRAAPVHALTPPEAHPAYRRRVEDPILADRPATPGARRRFRTSGIMRAVAGAMPTRRAGDGKPLPRAYRGLRQRLTTGRLWAVTPPPEPSTAEREVRRAVQLADAGADAPARRASPALVVPMPRDEPYIVPPPPPDAAARLRFALGALLVVAAALMWIL